MTDTSKTRTDEFTPTGEETEDAVEVSSTETETEIDESENAEEESQVFAGFTDSQNVDSFTGGQDRNTSIFSFGEGPEKAVFSTNMDGDTETHAFSETVDPSQFRYSDGTNFQEAPQSFTEKYPNQTEISQEDAEFFAQHPDGNFESLSAIKRKEEDLARNNPYDLEKANIIDEDVFRTNYRDHKKKPFYLSDNYKRAWDNSFRKFMEANDPDEIVSSAILGVLKFMAELPKERLKYAREEQREENKYVKEKKKKYIDGVLYAKGISQDNFYKHMADTVYGDEKLIQHLEEKYPKIMKSIPKDENGIYDMNNLTRRQTEMLTRGVREYAEHSPKLKNAIENIVGLRMTDNDMKRYAIGLAGKHSQISRHQAIQKGLLKDVKSPLAPKRDAMDAVDELRASFEAWQKNMSDRDALRMARNKSRTKTGENSLSFEQYAKKQFQHTA